MKHSELTKDYENMGFYTYENNFKGMPGLEWGDASQSGDTVGILKANYYIDGKLRQIFSKNDSHSVIVAGTGLGKTSQFVIPYVKYLPWRKLKASLVISDPKGEILAACGDDLVKAGYRLLLFNFRDTSKSECWNPLTKIFRKFHEAYNLESEVELVNTPDGPRNKFKGRIYEDQYKLDYMLEQFRAKMLEDVACDIDTTANIVAPDSGSANEKMWEAGGRDILKAFLWAMLEDSRPETSIARELITEDTYSFETLLNISNFLSGGDCNNDRGYFSGRNKESKAYYYAANTVLVSATNTRAGFLSSFNSQVLSFKESTARTITRCNSIEFDDLMDEPTAIFINYRDEAKTSYALISLFVQSLYIHLIKEANKRPRGKLERPWYFILDEFGNFPRMADFDTVISACRGRNIFFNLVIQSYAQLEGVYGKNTADIIKDNLNLHIFMGSNNVDTLEAFSRECGHITRISPMSAVNGSKEYIENYQLETIRLMPVSRLAHLEEGECVITEANTGYVMFTKLERYYKCPELNPDKAFDLENFAPSVNPYDRKYSYVYEPKGRRY